MQEEKGAPAIGASITMTLGGDRQIVLQTFYARDDEAATIHANLDKLFMVADRQKARYELLDLAVELTKHVQTLSQFTEDLARVDLDYETKQQTRRVAISTYQDDATKVHDDAYDQFVNMGRKGAFSLSGHAKANHDRLEAAAGNEILAIEKDEKERAAAKEGLGISIRRYNDAIDSLTREIAKREAIVGA